VTMLRVHPKVMTTTQFDPYAKTLASNARSAFESLNR
jgi:hypothetical protein